MLGVVHARNIIRVDGHDVKSLSVEFFVPLMLSKCFLFRDLQRNHVIIPYRNTYSCNWAREALIVFRHAQDVLVRVQHGLHIRYCVPAVA